MTEKNKAGGRIGVIGAGSWGTALAVHFAGAGGHEVRLWARHSDLVARLAAGRSNPDYLPGVTLPPSLQPTSDLRAIAECDLIHVVVPSHGFREVLRQFLAVCCQERPAGQPVSLISGTKGIEIESLSRMSQIAAEEGAAAGCAVRFAVLSGPTFAAELARNAPSAAVVASDDPGYATEIRQALATRTLRLYSSADVVGVELGGAVKNVIGIAAGAVSGLGLGHNTLAALITRGLHEITRLGIAYGGQPATFAGLAGLGDLVLTCTGGLSRNRQTGLDLAAGKTVAEITSGHTVSEGIRNSIAVSRLATQRGVDMPITRQMVAVMHEGKDPRRAVEELMTRELKSESEL